MRIPLTRGQYAIVDPEDYEILSQYKWHAKPISRKTGGYYACSSSAGKKFYMHRLILNAEKAKQVDHINGNGLDNRKANLRLATQSQNSAARASSKPRSGYRGVYAKGNYFRAQAGGKPCWMGPTRRYAVQAALDYDAEAVRRFGEFARPNFPCVVAKAKGGES